MQAQHSSNRHQLECLQDHMWHSDNAQHCFCLPMKIHGVPRRYMDVGLSVISTYDLDALKRPQGTSRINKNCAYERAGLEMFNTHMDESFCFRYT